MINYAAPTRLCQALVALPIDYGRARLSLLILGLRLCSVAFLVCPMVVHAATGQSVLESSPSVVYSVDAFTRRAAELQDKRVVVYGEAGRCNSIFVDHWLMEVTSVSQGITTMTLFLPGFYSGDYVDKSAISSFVVSGISYTDVQPSRASFDKAVQQCNVAIGGNWNVVQGPIYAVAGVVRRAHFETKWLGFTTQSGPGFVIVAEDIRFLGTLNKMTTAAKVVGEHVVVSALKFAASYFGARSK